MAPTSWLKERLYGQQAVVRCPTPTGRLRSLGTAVAASTASKCGSLQESGMTSDASTIGHQSVRSNVSTSVYHKKSPPWTAAASRPSFTNANLYSCNKLRYTICLIYCNTSTVSRTEATTQKLFTTCRKYARDTDQFDYMLLLRHALWQHSLPNIWDCTSGQ